VSVADDLRAARALIATPERWTQGLIGTTPDGDALTLFEVDANVPVACLCAVGAIRYATRNAKRTIEATLALGVGEDLREIVDWNNAPEQTHAGVLAAFDRAIKRLS
jgi:hypothetical protein